MVTFTPFGVARSKVEISAFRLVMPLRVAAVGRLIEANCPPLVPSPPTLLVVHNFFISHLSCQPHICVDQPKLLHPIQTNYALMPQMQIAPGATKFYSHFLTLKQSCKWL